MEVDELLLFGQLVGAYWSSWPPAACAELIGRAETETAWGAPVLSYGPLSLEEFRIFCAFARRQCHGSLPWPPGVVSPGSWLSYALGASR